MFRRLAAPVDTLADISRIEDMVRDQYRIPNGEIILVSEDPGTKPGFPPKETNILFWKEETRYRLKIFSPVSEVTGADLPIRWLLPSLEDTGEGGCC